ATKREREAKEGMGIASLGGLEKTIRKIVGDDTNLAELVKADSNSETDGKGAIGRQEKVTTKVAAVVTQILPNGNMVIEGRQEVRVNYEKRELIVAGVVRPEDITAENNIPISKIAEARVSYGGKGTLTDVQQPRYGQQLLDIILPF
ncbi:MAG: flagellar basal body L-ring protein FlgH, partial [Hyphomicrobiales bacterium]